MIHKRPKLTKRIPIGQVLAWDDSKGPLPEGWRDVTDEPWTPPYGRWIQKVSDQSARASEQKGRAL